MNQGHFIKECGTITADNRFYPCFEFKLHIL